MTKVIDTTSVALTSSEITPTDDFFIETSAAAPGVIVEVQAKVESGADYVTVMTVEQRKQPIFKVTKLPFVKVAISGNTKGSQVSVWVV